MLLTTVDVGPRGEHILAALTRELLREDERGAVTTVFAQSLPILISHSGDWLSNSADDLFGGHDDLSRSQQIALTTALATLHPHIELLEILRRPMLTVLETSQALTAGWAGARSPELLIGDWIVDLYVRTQLPINDELVIRYFSAYTANVRGDVLGHLGWQFMRASSVDQVCLDRAAALWDSRVDAVGRDIELAPELSQFFWWVRSDHYAAAWWVPRLQRSLELCPRATTRGMIGDQLTRAATTFPGEVLNILKHLTAPQSDDEYATVYLTLEPVVVAVIASALDSSSTDVSTSARDYMDELGSRGFLDLKRLVDDYRRSP